MNVIWLVFILWLHLLVFSVCLSSSFRSLFLSFLSLFHQCHNKTLCLNKEGYYIHSFYCIIQVLSAWFSGKMLLVTEGWNIDTFITYQILNWWYKVFCDTNDLNLKGSKLMFRQFIHNCVDLFSLVLLFECERVSYER